MSEETPAEQSPQEEFDRLYNELYRRNAQWAHFVVHYLGNGFNARQGAISAGYSEANAHNQGYRLTINDDVSPVIAAGKSAMKATPEEILMRMTRRARGTIEDFITQTEDGSLAYDMTSERAMQSIGNVREIKFMQVREEKETKHGMSTRIVNKVDLKLHDAMKADEILGKHHGLFVERVEHGDSEERQKRSKEEREHELAMMRRIRKERAQE